MLTDVPHLHVRLVHLGLEKVWNHPSPPPCLAVGLAFFVVVAAPHPAREITL
jgi:hypothetical protein